MTDHEKMIITKYDLLFESRLTKIETTMENINLNMTDKNHSLVDSIKEIKSDIRWMFGIMLGFQAVVLSLMAKGFHWFV